MWSSCRSTKNVCVSPQKMRPKSRADCRIRWGVSVRPNVHGGYRPKEQLTEDLEKQWRSLRVWTSSAMAFDVAWKRWESPPTQKRDSASGGSNGHHYLMSLCKQPSGQRFFFYDCRVSGVFLEIALIEYAPCARLDFNLLVGWSVNGIPWTELDSPPDGAVVLANGCVVSSLSMESWYKRFCFRYEAFHRTLWLVRW